MLLSEEAKQKCGNENSVGVCITTLFEQRTTVLQILDCITLFRMRGTKTLLRLIYMLQLCRM